MMVDKFFQLDEEEINRAIVASIKDPEVQGKGYTVAHFATENGVRCKVDFAISCIKEDD